MTWSGKGVALVVPTLLTWPGSRIVHNIKGENGTVTPGFHSRHGRALLFDPTTPKSAAYSPLLEATFRAMMTTAHLGEAGPHPMIASAARELLKKSERERSGALSTAMSSH
jgi:type IV secretory pathway TraG/TraD family ATPase VirD4